MRGEDSELALLKTIFGEDFPFDKIKDATKVEIPQEKMESLYAHGYGLYNHSKYEDAVECFRVLIATEPMTAKYWIGAGACYQMIKDYQQANLAYAFATLLQPENPYTHFHAAECFFSVQNVEKGLAALKSAETCAKQDERHAELLNQVSALRSVWEKPNNNTI